MSEYYDDCTCAECRAVRDSPRSGVMTVVRDRAAEDRQTELTRELQAAITLRPTWTDPNTIDPSVRWTQTRNAMLTYMREQGSDGLEGGRRALRHITETLGAMGNVWSESGYWARMAEVRQAGIDAYAEGLICFSGTNEFFDAFDIDNFSQECGVRDYTCNESDCAECNPERDWYVTVQATITYRVNRAGDSYDVQDDAQSNLTLDIDASDLDGYVENESVQIDRVTVRDYDY